MNVYIKIEIKDREFISRTLIAAYLAKKGHDVYVGDDEFIGRYLENKILNPGIILEKSLSPVKRKIKRLSLLKKNNFKIVNLDEEGGLNDPNYKYWSSERYSNKTLKIADISFCWGRYDYEMNKKLFPKFKKKFYLSGNPRFDLHNVKNIENKKIKKKIIIIPSTFTLTAYKRIVDEFDIYSKLRKPNLNIQKKWFIGARERSIETFDLLDLIYEIKKKFNNLLIEIWVHPKEDIDMWRKLIPEDKHIKYTKIKDFNSTSSDKSLFIFTGSTLGMDVMLNNRFLVYYNPSSIFKGSTIPIKMSKKVNSAELMLNIIKKFFNGKKFKQSFKMQNYIHNSKKNIIASSIIADKIDELNSKDISKKNTFLNNNLNHLYAKNYLRLIRQKIDYKIYNDKFAPFSKSEIKNVHKTLIDFNKEFKKIKIELIGPKLIRLNKTR
tara:strand:+ start:2944 stop:4254 length:1311 start_codon:yes stop_codon:yes gene_type:complete